MDVESYDFFILMASASAVAALAAQSRELNGKCNPVKFFAGWISFTVTGFACGVGMSRWVNDAGSVISAVMAIVLLRLVPEEIFTGVLNRLGISRHEIPKDKQKDK